MLVILGALFLGILFLIGQGLRGLIGALSGLSMTFFIGFGYIRLYAWFYQRVCIDLLREKFLAGILNTVLGFPQVIPLFMLPIFFLAFFMTPQMMHSVVVMRELKERNARRKKAAARTAAQDEDLFIEPATAKTVFPATLLSPKGETYQLNHDDGTRAEYLCRKTGHRVSFYAVEFEDGYPSGWNAY